MSKGERKGEEEVWGWQRKRGGAETLGERVRKRGRGKYSGGRAEIHKQGGFEEEQQVTASNVKWRGGKGKRAAAVAAATAAVPPGEGRNTKGEGKKVEEEDLSRRGRMWIGAGRKRRWGKKRK